MNLFDEFLIETSQLLEEAEDCLMAISNGDNIDENWKHFLRIVHSVKGSAGFMEKPDLESHCHKIESCFTGQYEFDEAVITYLFKFVDHCQLILKNKAAHIEFTYYNTVKDIQSETPMDIKKDERPIDLILVDDDHVILTLMSKYLDTTNLNYKCFDNPYEALDTISESSVKPKMVISDIQMPGMSGVEFLREFKRKIGDIPFMFVTALNDTKVFLDLVNEGAYAVMQKPLEKNEFIYKVNQTMKFAVHKLIADKCVKNMISNFSELTSYYESINKPHLTSEIKKEIEEIYELKSLTQ